MQEGVPERKEGRKSQISLQEEARGGSQEKPGDSPLPFNPGGEWTACPRSCCRPRQRDSQRSKATAGYLYHFLRQAEFRKGEPEDVCPNSRDPRTGMLAHLTALRHSTVTSGRGDDPDGLT